MEPTENLPKSDENARIFDAIERQIAAQTELTAALLRQSDAISALAAGVHALIDILVVESPDGNGDETDAADPENDGRERFLDGTLVDES